MNLPWQLGDRIDGRYELLRLLGEGGLGAVYEALDARQHSRVAIKLLRAEFVDDATMRRRLRREAAILRALDHPSIVRVTDLGLTEQGAAYLVTRLLEGQTLRARIEERAAAASDVCRWMIGLAGGLACAHGHGVVHGDLKPDNVVLVGEGGADRPHIIDFGTSKVVGLERLTATGELAGTPVYMAPELLTGQGTIGNGIDIYALGVIAYEALAGAPPFQERKPGQLLFQIVSGDALPLRTRADVPEVVAAVVEQAMHADPAQRHQSAEELERAWKECLLQLGDRT